MTRNDGGVAAYRPCVGVMLINSNGGVFVGNRRDTAGNAWQMPQGVLIRANGRWRRRGASCGRKPVCAVRA